MPKRGGVSIEALKKSGLNREGEARLQSFFFPFPSLPRAYEKNNRCKRAEFKFFLFFKLHLVPTIIVCLFQSAVAALYLIKMTKMAIGIFNQGKVCYIPECRRSLGQTIVHSPHVFKMCLLECHFCLYV